MRSRSRTIPKRGYEWGNDANSSGRRDHYSPNAAWAKGEKGSRVGERHRHVMLHTCGSEGFNDCLRCRSHQPHRSDTQPLAPPPSAFGTPFGQATPDSGRNSEIGRRSPGGPSIWLFKKRASPGKPAHSAHRRLAEGAKYGKRGIFCGRRRRRSRIRAMPKSA